MKKTKIIFWIFTVLFTLAMLSTAVPEILNLQDGNKFMLQLGYPPYLNMFLGVAKILGVIVLLIPGFPRLKEWTFAGFFFDLAGATYSQVAVGWPHPDPGILFMGVFFLLFLGSYVYYHKLLKEKAMA